jgi:hypothetical protein
LHEAVANVSQGFVTKKPPLAAIMLDLRCTARTWCLNLQHSRACCAIADGMDY